MEKKLRAEVSLSIILTSIKNRDKGFLKEPEFMMKRQLTTIFLATVLALSISGSSAYVCYYTVASADFLSHHLKLERFDQEYLSASGQNELKEFGPAGFFNGSSLANHPIGIPFHFFPYLSSSNLKNVVLRC